MKDRPILFSGPMVRAILEGRKTQTRRLAKLNESLLRDDAPLVQQAAIEAAAKVCPYGVPGDRLWVRETWATGLDLDAMSPSEISRRAIAAGYQGPWAPLRFLANGCTRSADALSSFGHAWGRDRRSLHMPRWASRITLEITNVRVQRLQDISDEDARAEGVTPAPFCKAGRPAGMEHVEAVEGLWDSINGKRAPWAANPWVWALTFKRLSAEEASTA